MNTKQDSTISLLFICLGNICRSPAAHAVFCKMIAMRKQEYNFIVDSAGIGNWHVGQLPDSRMRTHGSKRGYEINHHARQFNVDDFNKFDYIIVMDEDNYRIITGMAQSKSDVAKVIRMSDYFNQHSNNSVPDPYYGDSADFELALDLIEDGCDGLLKKFSLSEKSENDQIETK
ncbi:MAG: low molecular weight phosphotyrosine protein phosphatase [Prevotella sp.]|nr:low molecular weight phosphotyrosine protein phosphatase [Prevotella sp.]